MIKYKKYVYFLICFILLLILYNFFIWTKYTKDILLVDDYTYTGDLGRMALKKDIIYKRPSYLVKDAITLPKSHFSYKNRKENVDIITIGDSFSNAATQGINPFYQDYIATYYDLDVLNITPSYGFINFAIILLNSGILDELKPKAIVLESVERYCINRFGTDIDFLLNKDINEVKNTLNSQENVFLKKDPYISFINDKNTTALIKNIQYKFKKYGEFKNFIISKLNKDFFSVEDSNSLLFYKEDIDSIPLSTIEKINLLNKNLNKLAKLLAKKNIKLYFMPVVDKYNLYGNYLVNNIYPKSTFFEKLRPLKKSYYLIDTKKILEKSLKNGEKDIFYSDDTHWSYKASEKVIKEVKFEKL